MIPVGLSETLKALSDPQRREILALLKQGKMSAGEISSHFKVTATAVSYHLNYLKKADLIHESKNKNFVYFTLNTSVLEGLLVWLNSFRGGNTNETEDT